MKSISQIRTEISSVKSSTNMTEMRKRLHSTLNDMLEAGYGRNEEIYISFTTDLTDGCVYFEAKGIEVGGTFSIDANGCLIYTT